MKKIFLRFGVFLFTLTVMSVLGAGTVFAGTTPAISNIDHKNGVNRVLVEFNAPVWGDTAYTTALGTADFQLGGTCGTGVTTISGVTHAAGNDYAVLTVNGTVNADMSTGSCTIAAVANSIFTVGGALSEKTLAWDGSADSTPPTISSATALNAQAEVMVTFSERVYGEADGTADLVNADLAYDDAAGGSDGDACTGTAAGTTAHTAGNNWAVWTCSVALTTAADIDDNEEMDLAGAANVYDLFGNAAIAAQNANLAADAGVPTFATGFVALKAEATVGATKILVKFSEPVFNAAAPTMAADLVAADFTYVDTTAGVRLLTTATPTVDQKWAVLTLTTALAVADITDATADTINATNLEVFDAFAQNQATTTMKLADNTDPVIVTLAYDQATGANVFKLTYSEPVTITGLTTPSATMAASTATVGDLAVAGALQGFGAFATAGTITVPTTLNTLAIDSTQTIITVTIAGAPLGYMATSTTTATVPSGVFTPEITGAGIQDLRPAADTANDIEITSTQSTLTTTTAWDTTRPTISSGVLSDTFFNNAAFVAGGTFNAGSDGRADQVTFTASEVLKGSTLLADAAGTRNDWAVTGAAGEYGNSLVVIKASAVTAGNTGTTYTLNFSGAQSYYSDPSTFSIVNTQDAAPSFTDRAGNPVASGKTGETYKICFTGLTCASSSIGNVAVITNGVTQPSNSANDTTAPSAPTSFKAELTADYKVKLTWVDPTATDFSNIKVYRIKNGGAEEGLEVLQKGDLKFTDTKVAMGDVLKYRLSAFDMTSNESTKTDYAEITVAIPEEEEVESYTVNLTAQNESGVSGTATITEEDGMAKVVLALTGSAAGVAQPAHLHSGSCATLGEALYNLTDATSGASTTTLEVSLDDLRAQLPLAINVHKSAAEAAVYQACGDVTLGEPLEEVEISDNVSEEGVMVDNTGMIVEEVTLQDPTSGAAATIKAGTTATVSAEDGTEMPYTGTIMPPMADAEQEVTVPEGYAAASEVYDVETGATGSVMFDLPVTLVFPAGDDVDADMVYTMYTVDPATGALTEPVECAVKMSGESKVFECETPHLSKFIVLAMLPVAEEDDGEEEEEPVDVENPFVDVEGHWSLDYVVDLFGQDIVSGKDATHFKPDDAITRAEFTKIIVNAYGLEMMETVTTMPFSDVKSGDWFVTYVDAAKTAGITAGYPDGTFKPNAPITRAEALKILLEAAEVDFDGVEASSFGDVKQGEWYAKYVNYAAANDVVKGYADGTFGVNKNITRAETAKVVSLMLE